MILVLDASMALAWIYARENPAEAACADRVLQIMSTTEVVVPTLWYTEIANALLVGERRGLITEAQTIDYLARLYHLPTLVDDTLPSARQEQVMALAREHRLTAYDAIYLELALRRGAMLATFDGRLARAMQAAGGTLFT